MNIQIPHKVLYIEEKPIQRQITFNSKKEYYDFWNDYYRDILNYCYKSEEELRKGNGDIFYRINPKEYYQYESHLLNKDGSISKKHNAVHLLTPEARKKQKKNFAVYCEKRKRETIEKGFKRKLWEIDSKLEYWQEQKDMLIENHKKEIEN
jgi:hypothetical protein